MQLASHKRGSFSDFDQMFAISKIKSSSLEKKAQASTLGFRNILKIYIGCPMDFASL
jgi:hypothetical protein